jgi:LppX_LprAFG lipoprotein
MTPLSAHSPHNSGRGRRRAAAVALCAAALAVMAGCSTGSGSSSVPLGTTGPAGGTGTATRLSPQRAIRLAADESLRVNSMAATLSEQIGNPVVATTSATIQVQLRPALLVDESLHTTASGRSASVNEIVSARAVYLKEPGNPAGKPWIKIPLSELGHNLGASLSSLLQNAQNGNPAEQTQLLTASKNVRVVGTELVNGVETTHYQGSLSAATAIARLRPALRKGLAPLLRLITGEIHFDVWIDGQHVTRRLVEVETVLGEQATVTVNVTAVNQPVQITLPPPSQVKIVPKSQLGGL